ncbi:hypothetical protein H0H92_016039 [Tricholoma furcatifolium]|nr:hypothetical protein H0H92_016039 [Tricholoma furcatifolium]
MSLASPTLRTSLSVPHLLAVPPTQQRLRTGEFLVRLLSFGRRRKNNSPELRLRLSSIADLVMTTYNHFCLTVRILTDQEYKDFFDVHRNTLLAVTASFRACDALPGSKTVSASALDEIEKSATRLVGQANEDYVEVSAAEQLKPWLVQVFKDKDMCERLQSCDGQEAQDIQDTFQSLSYSEDIDKFPRLRQNLVIANRRLSNRTKIFPTSFYLDHLIVYPFRKTKGAFGEVFKGRYRGKPVCVKVMRLFEVELAKLPRILAREAVAWGQLKHLNLLPFYGLYRHEGNLSLVSPWAENGTLSEFLKREKKENRLQSKTRLLLCSDIVQGIQYLHDHHLIHGDLKGVNILIDKAQRAYIGDFGLSSVDQQDLDNWSRNPSSMTGGTDGYMAPEHLDLGLPNTTESDIFSFSMVCWEIFTDHIPFAGLVKYARSDAVRDGKRPPYPLKSIGPCPDYTPALEKLTNDCWNVEAARRPTISQVASRLAPLLPTDERREGDWQESNKSIMSPLRARVKEAGIPLTKDMLAKILERAAT